MRLLRLPSLPGRVSKMTENRWFTVTNIPYQDALRIAENTEIIACVRRDPEKNQARYFPGTPGVLTYLKTTIPDGSTIWDEKGFVYGKVDGCS